MYIIIHRHFPTFLALYIVVRFTKLIESRIYYPKRNPYHQQEEFMGKPTSKSITEKEKSTSTKVSPSAGVQQRMSIACNTTRRRTIGAVMADGNHSAMNRGDAVPLQNASIAPSHSDMSGDDDESQQSASIQNKNSPPARKRTSLVNEFADKMSSNEYKCKLC